MGNFDFVISKFVEEFYGEGRRKTFPVQILN
jgi:hypothetical protein